MRRVEAAEDESEAASGGRGSGAVSSGGRPGSAPLHLAIINLVIGTLYCSKVCARVPRNSLSQIRVEMACRLQPPAGGNRSTAVHRWMSIICDRCRRRICASLH